MEKSADERKVHISRVPVKFTEEIVKRILQEKLGFDDTTQNLSVELVYPRDENEIGKDGEDISFDKREPSVVEDGGGDAVEKGKEHRGFGFVTFDSNEVYEKALAMEKVKGGRKPTSKKLHTMYIRPYATNEEETNVCYLWKQGRCPYFENCKFSHVGPGSCVKCPEVSTKKKKGKCFAFKKGKCDKGDDCPFSHDFAPNIEGPTSDGSKKEIPNSEKDCINWKTKGKCKKMDRCPYRHDPEVQQKALDTKKRKRESQSSSDTNSKEKQPICIRVFGMAYDTSEADIRQLFEDCGKIQSVSFPTFEDSGRSKGYCGVWFSSPKAVAKAVELNGHELHGRWLSIQAGKMYLKQWEANHKRSRISDTGKE